MRQTAANYLIWPVIIPLISFSAFVYDGLCIGTTQSQAMRNAMLLSVLLGFLPTWYLLSHCFPMHKNHMLWLSFSVFFVIRGLGMYWFCETVVKTEVDSNKNVELK